MVKFILFLLILFLAYGCAPNTYYSTTDDYVNGLRWYDRGNYENASKYWDPLVEKGDCDAEYRVGLQYFMGQGKPQNNAKALELWTKAANGNHQRAQMALGDLYYGKQEVTYHDCAACGLETNLTRAYFWYRLMEKSAKYDNEKKYAKEIISEISSEMTKDQIKETDEQIANWTPVPKDCGARSLW